MWNELISMENLLLAYKKASKNRRSRQEIANFEFELEKNLFQIRDKLADGSYHHNSPSLGGDAETSEVSRRGTHNLFSKAGAIHSARRSQFNQQSVLISLRMASSPCVLSTFYPVSAGTPRQARFPARHPQFIQKSVLISRRMASSPYVLSKFYPVSAGTPRQARFPARHPKFIQQGVIISLRMASSPCALPKNHPVSAGTPRQARFPVMAPTIYSKKRPYFASHGVLAMRFIKKRGFPAWQANFVKQGF